MQNRRAFLKQSAIIIGGLSLWYPSLTAKNRFDEKKLGVCLVGLGSYSSYNLAPALATTKYCELRGIVTGSEWKIPVWQKKYNIPDKNVYSYNDIPKIANNPDIDVLYIVVPTGLHAKYAIAAANAGKHVWCEKPMAITAVECQAIIDACKQNNVWLSIGYRMQHEPNTKQFIAWGSSKPYGKIKTIKSEIGYQMVPKPGDWRMSKKLGGGNLYDLGVYTINGIRYCAQEEPVSVAAKHETYRRELFVEVSEVTTFELEFPSGLIGIGKYTARERVNLLRVNCEKGWYELNPFQTYNGIAGKTSNGLAFSDKIPNQQAVQMDDDALAILNKTPVMVPGEDGMKDIRILEAINRSAESGKKIKL